MDTIVTSAAPNNSAHATRSPIFLKITHGPEWANILESTSIPNRAARQASTFIVKFNNVPMEVEISFDGCRYDRYSSEHIILNGEITNLQVHGQTNKKVRKVLQRAKDFCSQVQLRYNYCTCTSGKLCLNRQPAA